MGEFKLLVELFEKSEQLGKRKKERMNYLFMDEKGPQNSFKITQPFDKQNKLSYANDNMHSYVAVSYTHLDVYKRQVFQFCVLWLIL